MNKNLTDKGNKSKGLLEKVLSRLQGVTPSGDAFKAHCPAHQDKELSLSLNAQGDGKVAILCRAGCEIGEIASALGIDAGNIAGGEGGPGEERGEGGVSIPPETTATLQPSGNGCTLAQYAEGAGLPKGFLLGLGLSEIHYMGKPAVRIPYVGPTGEELSARFWVAPSGKYRSRWKSGSKPCLYGLWRLDDACAKGYVAIVEGEPLAQALWHYGIPALGLPQSRTWNDEWDTYLEGIPTIYVLAEPGAGRQTLRQWISSLSFRDRVQLLSRTLVEKQSRDCITNGASFRDVWERIVEKATPWHQYEQGLAEAAAQDAWNRCKHLAQKPRILDTVVDVLATLGVVGEAKALKLIYLTVTSRLLDRPVSAVIKGESSSGKSYVVEQVLKLFPPTAYYKLTAMSERALVYSQEPLAHRVLVVFEAAALQGEFGGYLLRSLLSEGCLRYETVEKTKDGLKPRLIEREGPTGLLITTTAVHLHEENETRLFSISVTETPEQTRRVMLALAEPATQKLDLSEWHALQELMQCREHKVVLPYAKALAELTQVLAVRMRRDFGQLLKLIEAHALLHRASRPCDEQGRIIATLDDYAVVRDLVADLVAESMSATVPPAVRATVTAVTELRKQGNTSVKITDVAKHLGLNKSTVSRRVTAAINLGHLRKYREIDLTEGFEWLDEADPLPDKQVLPTVDALQQHLRDGGCSVACNPEGIAPPSPPSHGTRPISRSWQGERGRR